MRNYLFNRKHILSTRGSYSLMFSLLLVFHYIHFHCVTLLPYVSTQNFKRGHFYFPMTPVMPPLSQLCVSSETGIRTPARQWCFVHRCLQSNWAFSGVKVQSPCPACGSGFLCTQEDTSTVLCFSWRTRLLNYSPPPRSPP